MTVYVGFAHQRRKLWISDVDRLSENFHSWLGNSVSIVISHPFLTYASKLGGGCVISHVVKLFKLSDSEISSG